MQGIDALRRQPLAVRVGQQLQRPCAGTQQDLLVRQAVPRRAVRIHPRQRAGDRATVGERLVTSPQPVEGLHAREADERGIALERQVAQAVQGVLAGLPRGGRIDDEQRAVVAAELRRDEQDAGPDVAITCRRRHAEKMQVVDAAQRKQAGAAFGRADQVVIGERRTVVTVGIRVDVTDRVTRARTECALGSHRRYRAAHSHQLGFLQRRDDEPGRARFDRQPAENFLVFDVLGAERAHALHDEVEAVLFVERDVVVIDGGAQHLARARTQRFEHQLRVAARQADGGRRAAVHDPHDDCFAAAVVEVLFDGIGQHARLPQPPNTCWYSAKLRTRTGRLTGPRNARPTKPVVAVGRRTIGWSAPTASVTVMPPWAMSRKAAPRLEKFS